MSKTMISILLAVNLGVGVLGGFIGRELAVSASSTGQSQFLNATSSGEFRVLDSEGNVRVSIAESGIVLFDRNLRQRIHLRTEPTAGIHILDEQGAPRAELFLYPEGEGHLYLHDIQGRMRTVLDEAELAFLAPDSSEVLLSRDELLPGGLSLSSSHAFGPAVALRDNLGRAFLLAGRETLEQPDGTHLLTPRLLIFDNEGKVRWSSDKQESASFEPEAAGGP